MRQGHRVAQASSQLALGIRVDPVLFDLVEQRAVADLEQLGGARAIALRLAERGAECRVDTKRKIILGLGFSVEDRRKVFPDGSTSEGAR